MGKSKSSRVVNGSDTGDDDDGYDDTIIMPRKGVESYLEELLKKKGPKREKAMELIVEALTHSTFKSEVNFLQNNFATFLYRCLNLFKKGSVKELQLSAQAIGLLALIIDDEHDANEIYRDVIPVISKALQSGPKTLKVFDCLATSTFFGASNSEETQATMQMIWRFIHPDCDSKVSADVLVAAISAWLFLLSSLERWSISSKYWQGAIPYFSSLLENSDLSVSAAAGAAVALIFETGCVDKFIPREERSSGESSTSNIYLTIKEEVKDSILEILERFCLKHKGENSANTNCKEQLRVMDYIKNDYFQKVSVSIGKESVALSSWSKIIQLNYLKSFLGSQGLNAHKLENHKLQALFGSSEAKVVDRIPRKELYKPIIEEVTVNCYLPKERDLSTLLEKDVKKDRIMRHAIVDKAQTKLRSKKRELATEWKQTYGFDY